MFTKMSVLVKEARDKKELTQMQLAEALGYSSPQYVSNCERGLCSLPPSQFKVIAKTLSVSKKALREAHLADYTSRLDLEIES